jgi:hypothetical protein
MNPIHTFQTHIFKIHFNTILLSSLDLSNSLSFRFSYQSSVRMSLLPRAYNMCRLSHVHLFDHPNIQISGYTELQFYLLFCMGVKLGLSHWGRNNGLRVFENWVLREIFGPKRDEVTGEWRRLHNEELNDLYSSPNIVRAIKSWMRWAGHVARMG